MTIYDRIDHLERALDKDGLDHLNRRLLLRKALGAVRAEALAEGHTEGMRDALDARYAEQRAEKDAREVIPAGTGE